MSSKSKYGHKDNADTNIDLTFRRPFYAALYQGRPGIRTHKKRHFKALRRASLLTIRNRGKKN